jgi:hypothetical protein
VSISSILLSYELMKYSNVNVKSNILTILEISINVWIIDAYFIKNVYASAVEYILW